MAQRQIGNSRNDTRQPRLSKDPAKQERELALREWAKNNGCSIAVAREYFKKEEADDGKTVNALTPLTEQDEPPATVKLKAKKEKTAGTTPAEILGSRLLQLREQKGIPLKEAGEAAGCDHGTLKVWEQGSRLPNILAVIGLAKLYEVSLDTL